MIFGGGELMNTKCAFWKISYSKKNWAKYAQKCILVYIWSAPYTSQTIMKLELSRQIFEKCSNTKFHENTSGGSGAVPCARADRHEVNSRRLSQFWEHLKTSFVSDWYIMTYTCDGIRPTYVKIHKDQKLSTFRWPEYWHSQNMPSHVYQNNTIQSLRHIKTISIRATHFHAISLPQSWSPK
jgi:hypothetical protein